MSATAAAAPDAPAPKSGKKKLILIIAAVVLLAGGGGAGWYFTQGKKAEGAAEAKPAPKKPSIFMPMDLYTVNLRNEDIDQFLQIGMNLQLESADAQKAITDSMPVIRSRILLLLSSQKSDHLMKREGKLELASQVLEEIRQVIGPTAGKDVTAVHFSAFVIQ